MCAAFCDIDTVAWQYVAIQAAASTTSIYLDNSSSQALFNYTTKECTKPKNIVVMKHDQKPWNYTYSPSYHLLLNWSTWEKFRTTAKVLAKKKAERAYSHDILRQRVTDVTWLHYSNCFLALSTNIVHRYVLQSPPEFCLCRIEILDSNSWHNMTLEKSSLSGLIGHTKGYATHKATSS